MNTGPLSGLHVRQWIHSTCLRTRYMACRASSSSSLPRPRLNYKDITENVDAKALNSTRRNVGVPSDTPKRVALLYQETRGLARQVNELREERGTLSNVVRDAKSAGEKAAAITKASENKDRLHAMEQELQAKQEDLYLIASSLPNDTHPSTPIGSESHARVVSTHGPLLLPKNPLRDHLNVAKELDMVDMESGVTVTGSSWYFLRNSGALLELALINYAVASAVKAGFTPVTTPDVVKADIVGRCGFEPRDTLASQVYHIQKKGQGEQHVLVGTAEIPLAGMFARRIIPEKDLPILVAGIGRAFRAEAGARGADTRGLYRVHQFSKVELFSVTTKEQSDSMLDRLVDLQKLIFNGLNLPFRVLEMPSEELGHSAYRKYDIEAWMPGRGSWGEISSASNCTDYQARRLDIACSPKNGGRSFAHTLNGTAAAVPRLIVALLENGVILENDAIIGLCLPKVLEPFWVGDQNNIIRFI